MIIPVVLSGGAGSRLWPLSRSSFPKQFLAAPNGPTFLQNTLARVQSLSGARHLVVACNEAHRFLVQEQAAQIGCAPAHILVEGALRDTAPALALVAHFAMQSLPPEALLLILPADHLIPDAASFCAMAEAAAPFAAQGKIVTFGVAPTFPATGYGYLQPGEALPGGACVVQRFTEKPDAATAAQYLAAGGYCWNAGIVLVQPHTLQAALAKYHPELAAAAAAAAQTLAFDGLFTRPEAALYAACPSISLDYAVLEPAATQGQVVMLPFVGKWNDIGTWHAMWEETPHDAHGNAVIGQAQLTACTGCYVHSEAGSLIAAHGLHNQVIVHTPDATLVMPRDLTAEVKDVYRLLAAQGSPLASQHRTDFRPWGGYTVLAESPAYKIKKLWVKPQARLSLQSHQFRAEHWVVMKGTATVVRDAETLTLQPHQSVFLPQGCKHQLANLSEEMLEVVEVQVGSSFAEEDIVRYADDYGRAAAPQVAPAGKNG